MIFYPGLHHPGDSRHFERACISINPLRSRRKPFQTPRASLIVDSGAFTELARFGAYRHEPADYAQALRRVVDLADVAIAVSQDFMCEAFMLSRTGLTLADHQRLTIERYDALLAQGLPCPLMPVLQGYDPGDYARHIRAYGARLKEGMWVGVGSVCKRNAKPSAIMDVLDAVQHIRPDLRLHGFGVKATALAHPGVRGLLYSSDSMAWSYAAKRTAHPYILEMQKVWGCKAKPSDVRAHYAHQGVTVPDPNDWRLARAFTNTIEHIVSIPGEWQPSFQWA